MLDKILRTAVNAPSGSNSQPWSFKINNNEILVFAHPEKDHPILNYRNRGTWIAHGALIENIVISAATAGYQASVFTFPEKNLPNLTAKIILNKGQVKDSPLFAAISRRLTNRRPYAETPLTPSQRNEFIRIGSQDNKLAFKLVEDKKELQTLGEALSVNEIVMFENKLLHQLFFKELVWTSEGERKRGGGLFLKTMELKPPQEKALKLFRYWPVMNLLNKLGAARSIAKGNAKGYASVSAMTIIGVDDKDADFIEVGRLIERLWLQATAMGLSAHLITGVFFFWKRIMAEEAAGFSSHHIELIKNAYEEVRRVANFKNKIITAVLRFGKGSGPTTNSFKKPPQYETN